MNQHTKRRLHIAAAAILAALLVALTVNVAVDFWTPQADLRPAQEAAVAPVDPATLNVPKPSETPAAPMPQQSVAPAQPWNQPLFDPKFDGPGLPGGKQQSYSAPDFSNALNPSIPLPQVSPPSVATQTAEPNVISIRPIFNSRAGGVDSGAVGGVLSGAGGTVGGATSGASSLLKR
jgi:hypothetical protein